MFERWKSESLNDVSITRIAETFPIVFRRLKRDYMRKMQTKFLDKRFRIQIYELAVSGKNNSYLSKSFVEVLNILCILTFVDA